MSEAVGRWAAGGLAFAILAQVVGPSAGAAQQAPQPDGRADRLIVGAMRSPPFAMRGDDGVWSGLSIDLWRRIAAELKVEYEFREYDYDPDGLLHAVERGQVDIAAAALPVSPEGETRYDYSHPYLTAGLGIAVRAEPQRGVFATLSSLFTTQLIAAIGGLFALLLSVGAGIWLLERRQNPQFDPDPVKGVGDGLWWAAVTMTTTGYGDKAPVTGRGRALGLVWMFASIFCIALFSATLASSFVVGRLKAGISEPADLARARVGAVAGTSGEQWLSLQGMTPKRYPFVIQAIKALRRGEVEALVFERQVLAYLFKEYGWRNLAVLPQTIGERDYAFAVAPESPLRDRINVALLKIVQGRDWKDTLQRYFGKPDESK